VQRCAVVSCADFLSVMYAYVWWLMCIRTLPTSVWYTRNWEAARSRDKYLCVVVKTATNLSIRPLPRLTFNCMWLSTHQLLTVNPSTSYWSSRVCPVTMFTSDTNDFCGLVTKYNITIFIYFFTFRGLVGEWLTVTWLNAKRWIGLVAGPVQFHYFIIIIIAQRRRTVHAYT